MNAEYYLLIIYSFIGLWFVLFALIYLLLFLSKKIKHPTNKVSSNDLPFVSILIAARNEAHQISFCIDALSKLNYPKDKFEILIGDDQSTDNTLEILSLLQSKYPNLFKIYSIEKNIGLAKGKSNVLAQLAHHAKGSYYFITDADIQVPEHWIHSLLMYFTKNVAIVSGSTIVDGTSTLAKCQKLDWVFAFSMVDSVARLKIPVSGVGNNMAIKKEVYWEIGGYENIPFSVVEDLDLFQKTRALGYSFINVLEKKSLAISTPQQSFKELIEQRHRWLKGVYRLSPLLISILFIHAFFIPFFLFLLYISPLMACIFACYKWALQSSFIFYSFKKINKSYTLKEGILFELYANSFPILLFIYSLFRKKVIWKGRQY